MNWTLFLPLALAALLPAAELTSGPELPMRLVKDWAKLPKGWNFGECSGVAVDKNDNVWVFNRGSHPVIELDKNGNFLQAWPDVIVKSSHGIKVDPDGNIWGVDVKGHVVIKYSPEGKVLMVLGNRPGVPGNNDSKDAFNEPTGLFFFKPDGSFYVSGWLCELARHPVRQGSACTSVTGGRRVPGRRRIQPVARRRQSWIQRAQCTWPIAATAASRSSMARASSSPSGRTSASPRGLAYYAKEKLHLYV